MSDGISATIRVHTAGEAFHELGKAGLITIIVVSLPVTVAFVWILGELRKSK